MPHLLTTQRTSLEILRVIRERIGPRARNAGGGNTNVRMVRCLDSAPVGGTAVLDECYPAIVLRPAADKALPTEYDSYCLLTLVSLDGTAAVPVTGGVYLCLIGNDATDDAEGSEAGRARAYGVVASEAGGGVEWVAALHESDCLRVTVVGADGAAKRLTSTDGETWSGDGIEVGGAYYYPTFARGGCDGPCLSLVRTGGSGAGSGYGFGSGVSYTGVRGAAGCAFATFGFSRRLFAPCELPAVGGPCANLIRVRVEWVPCYGGTSEACCSSFDGSMPQRLCVEWVGAGEPPTPRTFAMGEGEAPASIAGQWGANVQPAHPESVANFFSIVFQCQGGGDSYWHFTSTIAVGSEAISGRSRATLAETCGAAEAFDVVIYQGEDGDGPALWRVRAWTDAGCDRPATVPGWNGPGYYCVSQACEPMSGWAGAGYYCVREVTGGDDDGPIEES